MYCNCYNNLFSNFTNRGCFIFIYYEFFNTALGYFIWNNNLGRPVQLELHHRFNSNIIWDKARKFSSLKISYHLCYVVLLGMDKKTEIEAATFRRIIKHLQDNPEIQNIDLMNLANFCRNCISKWYVSESSKYDTEISYDEARELVYGMKYTEYKDKYQKEATKEQLEKFNASQKNKG